MHTDRKIGFAMGILLIGIVAALFFRNEPLLSTKVPGVRRERELNQRLRERDAAVYLSDELTENTVEPQQNVQPWTLRDVLKKMDERNKTAPEPVRARSLTQDSPDQLRDNDLDGYRPKKQRNLVESFAPEPTEPARLKSPDEVETGKREKLFDRLPPLLPAETADLQRIPLPPLPVVEPIASADEPPATVPELDFHPPELFDEYVVKYGDTLSGIAERAFGSQKRYIEIYNANRDRMASPDRLDVGKPLRIPKIAERDRTRL